MKIGVLALQGDFLEHALVLQRLGVEAVEVRLPRQLAELAGLIIPGGESTTIAKLATHYGLMDPLRSFAARNPVWGTCAGMIFLAKKTNTCQPLLGLMDIEVQRNAFGRQIDSFEIPLFIPGLENGATIPFPGVFIRAPKIIRVNGSARALASLPDGTVVAARENQWLATSFHPELTGDTRFHAYFLAMAARKGAKAPPAGSEA